MESPVRIKTGVTIILITLLIGVRLCNGQIKDEINQVNNSTLELSLNNSTETATLATQTEKTNFNQRHFSRNIQGRFLRKDVAINDLNSNSVNTTLGKTDTSDSSFPSSTSRIFFRGTTKFLTTKPPLKPKIPHMRRNFTRISSNRNKINSTDVSNESTIQNNEVFSMQKLKEMKLNETLEKLRESKNINKTINTINEVKSQINDIKSPPLNKSEDVKLIDQQNFDIDKYISNEFHDINNVYSQSISPEIEKYIAPENDSNYFESEISNIQVKPTSSERLKSRTMSLTTPRIDYFDRRYKEVSDSIKQNLADVDMDYANDEISTTDNAESKSNFSFDDVLSKPLSNDSTLSLKSTKETLITNSMNESSNHGNYEGYDGKKIVYEVSTVSSKAYDQVSKKIMTSESENIIQNEITTLSNRTPKSSSSHNHEQRTEPGVERRIDNLRTNYTRKEYVSTTRMRARTTTKPRIRISLKNNRNNGTQDSSSKETYSTNRGAEVVKMQPFSRTRPNILSTTSSKIDPIEITASDAIENFVSYLSKRGSTKYAEDFNSTSSKTSNDTASAFNIPPTATAWALITLKDTPFAKRNVSSHVSQATSPTILDNLVKLENEEINTVNSTLIEPVIEIKTSTSKKPSPTMEAGESNVEIVTSASIFTTMATQSSKKETNSLNLEKSTAFSKNLQTTTEDNVVEIDAKSRVSQMTIAPTLITTNSETNQKVSETNDLSKNVPNVVTQITIESTNTTSTIGTEINTEGMITTNSVTIKTYISDTTSPTVSIQENSDSQTTNSPVDHTTIADTIVLTTINPVEALTVTVSSKLEGDGSTEYMQSTKSFIDEYSTTFKPVDDKSSDKTTTELMIDESKSTTPEEDEMDDFNMGSKSDTPTEASGDMDENSMSINTENTEIPSTVRYDSTTMIELLTQPTTMVSKLTTAKSEKPTRYVTTLTTSLLPFSEDISDSREGKNKVVSEEDDKINNEEDWIDSDADTKIDSNEIPLPANNKTDAIETETSGSGKEIPNIIKNESTSKTTITTESNIEIIQSNTHKNYVENNGREYVETTTMFTEDVGDFEAVGRSGTIAAITVSVIGVVALLLLIGILLVARGRRQGGGYGQRCTPVSLDSYSLDNVSVNGSSRRKARRASKRSYGNPAYDEAGATSHPMQFAALANFAMDQESIMNEFNDIPMIHARTDEIPPGCETKNRFSNVIPLPETRVSLKLLPGDETSDYINANYVRGPKCLKKYYIASQAPMAATVNDFWRMIWEQNSRVVLMLTEFMENGVEKCYEYIPPSEVSDSRRTFGDYQIIIKKRDIRDKYVISQLQLKNLITKTWREITHMWYFWPAKGVPEECHSIIAFLLEARSYLKASQNAKEFDEEGHDSLITHNGSYANSVNVMENEDESDVNIYNVQRGEKTGNGNSKNGTLTHPDGTKRGGPMVVHCSPGTGRTGAVIACDIGIRDFEMSRTVDVPKTVYRIRRDRANTVQTKDQYVFVYKVLSEYATKLTGGVLDSI